MTPLILSAVAYQLGFVIHTGIGIAGEVASPGDEGLALVLAGGDGVCADGGDDGSVAQLRLGRDDGVGDEVVDALPSMLASCSGASCSGDRQGLELTECSSCLTSRT
jgi:hypothetical protein